MDNLLYLILKWAHVVLAIVAVGANATYGIWIARSSRNPEHLAYVLRTVKFIDDRIANPCYALLLVSGLGMVFLPSGPAITTPWLLVSLVLYVGAIVLGLAMYTPLGIIIGVMVLVIVFLMVVKPSFGV